ncbi:unnamed protein product, partial [Darwinula stevensoni]
MARIDDVMNYEVDTQFQEGEKDLLSDNKFDEKKLVGYFQMKNITFGYNTTMSPLIENFNLSLKPGSRVALVGGSGSGKSTVAKIASGLYEPWEGEVLFDGIIRKNIHRNIMTSSLAVIDQEVLVFNGTISENISFWDNMISEKSIVNSAKDADIHDVIASRLDAYDSEVKEGGANFSGGQRQRLEIARALANNPSILIMDEATSALDPTTEKKVMDNIKKRGCTCLIVAHRLSTIKDCDEIIVMEFGKIVERGTHSELIKLNGIDTKLLILAAFIGSLVGLLVPVLSGVMFDDVIPTADRGLHIEIFTIMIITGVVIAGLQLVQGILQLRVESKSSINLQAGVMDYILRLPVTFYKNYSAGDLTNRVLSINSIRQILSNTLITAVLSGAFSFVNLTLLFYYDSKLAWVGILLGFIAATFMIAIGLSKLKYDRQISEKQGELQGFLFEFLSGISKIRISGGEKRVFNLWAEKFTKLKRLGFNSGSYQNFVETFNSSYPLLTSIIFFSFIYYVVLNSDGTTSMISVGAFMAFITAFNKFLNDSLRLSMAVITSLNVIPLYERVKPVLEAEPESKEESTDPGELAGEIEMNSISFRYIPDQPLILNNISFKIKQGEMIAFVGASGSGKSTIMRLLLGFEQAESGSIFYDGESFDSMNKELVRRQIGVVLQNGSLMSGSIYQNIVGNSELTLDDAWEAARMAGMDEDIKHMPMEMHTVVSEGAGTFSGGQKQRLMIARAIVHKPRLLFMDEATSALDNRTQNIVSESLEKLQATRIVIAHRLSTIKNADRIYVMDKGQIVETGTYDELMKLDGLFSTLAKRQIA